MAIPMPVYQKVLNGHVRYLGDVPGDKEFTIKQTEEICHRAIKIDVSQAFRVYAEKKTDEIGPDDYPCCVPPWNMAWLEFDFGGLFRAGGAEKQMRSTPAAMLCRSISRSNGGSDFAAILDRHSRSLYDDESTEQVAHVCIVRPWGIDCACANAAFAQEYYTAVLINAIGRVIGMGAMTSSRFAGMSAEYTEALFIFARVAMFAFSLANCKNIVAEGHVGQCKTTGYVGRKRKQKKFYRYHILKISGGFSGAHESRGGNANRAMHICRGNFAKYTEDAPLFGRYTGLFWRPMHARGSVKNGVVDKDYQLAIA